LEFRNIVKTKKGYLLASQLEIEASINHFYFHSFGSLCLLRWKATACNSTTNPLWIIWQVKTMIFRAGMSSLMSSSFAAVSPFCGQPYAPLTASAK
jgi:hypothetical protein